MMLTDSSAPGLRTPTDALTRGFVHSRVPGAAMHLGVTRGIAWPGIALACCSHAGQPVSPD